MPKKSYMFKNLLASVYEYQEQGFTYVEISTLLKENHDLELTPNTLRNYLNRYGSKSEKNAAIDKDEPKQETKFSSTPVIEPSKSESDKQGINADKLEKLNAGFNEKQQQKAVVGSYFSEAPAFDATKYIKTDYDSDSNSEIDTPRFEAQIGSDEYKKDVAARTAKYFQKPIGISKLKQD